MSWDAYVNAHVVGSTLDKAFLVDVTGAALWAKSTGAEISPDEMKSIANAFNDASGVREAGIFLSGNKYFFTQLDDVKDEKSLPGRSIPVLHAAKGKQGVVAAKCTSGIIIAHYPEGVVSGDAIDATVRHAVHLIKNNV
ncbi:hypothetical protein Plec18170_004623 [Paecilomyces lecythidis]